MNLTTKNLSALLDGVTQAADRDSLEQLENEFVAYLESVPPPLDELVVEIPPSSSSALHYLAERLAVRGMVQKSFNLLVSALVCELLEGGRLDPRESLLRLAMIHFAAKRFGKTIEDALTDARLRWGIKSVPDVLSDFLSIDEPRRKLKSYGLEYQRDGAEGRFRAIPPPWQKEPNDHKT